MANFPGTQRRFFPGYYLGGEAEADTLAGQNTKWDTYGAPYKDLWTIPGEVYMGLHCSFGWGDFYTNENTRPTDPTDPDDPGYDWSALDSVLQADYLNDGSGKILLGIRDRSHSNPHPEWVKASPYNGTWTWTTAHGSVKTGTAYHRASASDELGYFYQALGKRYANDDRIAAIKTTEIIRNNQEPSDWNSPTGGGTGGLTGQDAYDWGNIKALSNLTTYMPNTVIIKMTCPPRLAYGIAGNPGAIELGMGAGSPDPRLFFQTCGDVGGGASDCPTGSLYWVMQQERDNAPIYQNSEGNGWNRPQWELPNPWNLSTNTDPDARYYMWYCSGLPRADAPDDDSGLGQVGADPIGIIPTHYIGCIVKATPSGVGLSGVGQAIEDWAAAIALFGPQGTQAAPHYPDGYPGQGGEPEPPGTIVRINGGDVSFVDGSGHQWDSDATYTSETGTSTLSGTLVNGTGYPDALFNKARLDANHDNSSFVILNVANGTYSVKLGFIETFSGASSGFRRFHIDIQGVRVATDYDIFDESGGLYTATVREFSNVFVTSEQITILLTDTAADRPHISFIEIVQQTASLQFAVEERTGPGVYVDRTLSVTPGAGGLQTVVIDKASVTDWAEIVARIESDQIGEQAQGIEARTDV